MVIDHPLLGGMQTSEKAHQLAECELPDQLGADATQQGIAKR